MQRKDTEQSRDLLPVNLRMWTRAATLGELLDNEHPRSCDTGQLEHGHALWDGWRLDGSGQPEHVRPCAAMRTAALCMYVKRSAIR